MADDIRPARVALLTLVVGAFYALQEVLEDIATGQPGKSGPDLINSVEFWVVWAALTPVVVAALRRWPPLAKPAWAPILAHTSIAVLLGVAQWALLVSLHNASAIWHGASLLAALDQASKYAFVWGEFAGCVFYATMVMVYAALRFRGMYIAEQLGAAELKAELTQSKLDALRSQLRPHFLFNTLNAISVFVTEDAAKAQQMLLRLSTLLRRSLDEDAHEVPLEQEISFLNDYLDIQRSRFGDRLEVRLDVAPDVLAARVPVLLLQPLLENAIEHGTWDDKRTTVVLTASRANGTVHISIVDDGPGLQHSSREGVGVGNTRARLKHLYGSRASVDLRSVDAESIASGTRVDLRLPMQTGPA